jgi:hypothetical protein
MHVTHNNLFILDPISKPPMTERGGIPIGGGLLKSGSASMLLNSGKKANL